MKVKLGFLVAVIAAGMWLVGSGCAHERGSADMNRPGNEPYLTGSYLPQNVDRNGPVTNGKNNVRVIDQSEIDRSGGANVGQSLRELGVTPSGR